LFNPVLSSTACGTGSQETLNYAWGADGRLANFSTTTYDPGGTPSQLTNTESAHWDGYDLLDVAAGSYVSNDVELMGLTIYVEKLGVITQNLAAATQAYWGTTIYDRDQSGTAVDRHGGTNSGSGYAWFAQLSLDNVHPYGTAHAKCMGTLGNFSCNGVVTNPPAATAGGSSCGTLCGTMLMSAFLDAGREDGYYDGTVSIQGVRAFDPNMNQWTTPDAYSGDVHDPMSQHPYMWNSNNAVQYEDPSGYIAGVATFPVAIVCPECAVVIAIGAVLGAGAAILKSEKEKADDAIAHGAKPEPQPGAPPTTPSSDTEGTAPRTIGGYVVPPHAEERIEGSRGDGGVSDEAMKSALRVEPIVQANGQKKFVGPDATVVTEGNRIVTAYPTNSKGRRSQDSQSQGGTANDADTPAGNAAGNTTSAQNPGGPPW
jgi:hypothetical protein